MKSRKHIFALEVVVAIALTAAVAWFWPKPIERQPETSTTIKEPVRSAGHETSAPPVTPTEDEYTARQWGWERAVITWDPEHWPPADFQNHSPRGFHNHSPTPGEFVGIF